VASFDLQVRRGGRGGFTLLETLLAALLLCITFLVLMTIYPSSIMAMHKGEQMTTACNYAQQLLESKRLYSFDVLSSDPDLGPHDVTINGTTYTCTLTLTKPAETDRDDYRVLHVNVSWEMLRGEGGRAVQRNGETQHVNVDFDTVLFALRRKP
jgi:type II secretory pathway pseudopilin PulG